MKDLIEALTIFAKYKNEMNPTCCGHDTLYIAGVTKNEVSKEDFARLNVLGFIWTDSEGWLSYRFGSA